MDKIIEHLGNRRIWAVLTSKRMIALYWHSGAMLGAGTLDVILEQLTSWDANNLITVFLGLIFAQITKYLNTKKVENPLPENN